LALHGWPTNEVDRPQCAAGLLGSLKTERQLISNQLDDARLARTRPNREQADTDLITDDARYLVDLLQASAGQVALAGCPVLRISPLEHVPVRKALMRRTGRAGGRLQEADSWSQRFAKGTRPSKTSVAFESVARILGWVLSQATASEFCVFRWLAVTYGQPWHSFG